VNEEAARLSDLDSTLRTQFGFSQGLRQTFHGKDVLIWLREGGIREDDPARFLRHFHDPLKPWADAGLMFFGQFQSSIHWMQRPTACDDATWRDGKDWTWSAARCYFRHALTEASAGDRDLAWAHTFRAVGQLMHLVVDASVPEHTRNDPHPLGPIFGNYEYWVEKQHGRPGSAQEAGFIATYLTNATRPGAGLLDQATGDAAAPVPVARLIDANVYTGQDPNATLRPAIGIAEFSNANFFSEDSGYRRFLAPNYLYPSVEALLPSEWAVPGSPQVRAYYRKGRDDGLPVDPVLAECALDAAVRADGLPAPQRKCVDANVWAQTAFAMLPRAAGYAAALVDYFFRGRLEGQLLPPAVEGGFPRIRVLNPAPSEGRAGEGMVGTVEAYYDAADGTRVPIGRWESQDLAAGTTRELTLGEPPPGAPPPADPGRYLLVFRGQLGGEPDAVAASWIDGRVWMLALGVTSYERDWWTSPPPTIHPAGPAYSRSLSSFDSTLLFQPPYEAAVADSHERSVTYLFTCQGPDYAPVLLGESVRGDVHYYLALYRGPAVVWGDSVMLRVSGYAGTVDSDGFAPAVVEVVKFATPRSPEELQSYTYDNPPTVETILYEAPVSREPVEVGPVSLTGASFVGVRVRPVPSYPVTVPDTGRGSDLDHWCFQKLRQDGVREFVDAAPLSSVSYGELRIQIPINP
jgi:hypothetical protein